MQAVTDVDDACPGRRRAAVACGREDNAVAEHANGILKTEWLYKMTIPTREVCKQELERIILFYNTERPHMSIGMQTPSMAHTQTGEQKRCWRNPWENHAAAPPD